MITGGGSGIGNAIAAALASEGVNVAIADVDPAVEDVARQMAHRYGKAVMGIRADVGDPEQVERLVESVRRQFGPLQILGNIAGIFERQSVVEMTPTMWDRTLRTNLGGVYLCTRAALPDMLHQGYGRIVSMASGIGVVGGANSSAYAASKAGVVAFTKSVALEVYAAGVRVNCIAPWRTDTPMMRGANTEDEITQAVERAGRPLDTPQDVVGSFLFLVSDASRTISGVTLWMRSP